MSNPFTVSKHPEQLKTTRLAAQSHDYDDPLPPKDLVFLQSVNEHECVIKSAQINSRLSNTFPMFLVLLVMTFYTLFTFFEGHNAKKYTFEKRVLEAEQSYFNQSSIKLNKLTIEYFEKYKPFFGRDTISWWEYIKAYNSGEFFIGSENDKYLIIGWLIFFPGFLYVLGSLSFFVPMTWLVADRKRGILYSYVDGIVTATRYEDAQFGYAGKMLVFKLFYVHPETGELLTHIYKPNISHYTGFLMSSDTEDHRFITFVNAYMQEGREAVSPTDYQARQPLFCFAKNPLPEDFEQQVQQILAKCDEEKVLNAQHR
ncbi:glycosyltransferase involved in cell wall biosynthesis [Providencia alcalifaciens]|nr:glycosyltransferase involved in cell wall biosynthesis [Providencia alcalifaciens]